ncbi:hypothetical protein ACEWY4_027507 [Coilia grayii]|uniref:TLC domain-containing protein n=1 Tax=Coilia grayii TaxID=363190 RepID=A0ABD1IRN2_9TELE
MVIIWWKFAFYVYIFTYGVRYLKKTPWLHNTRECWHNYPNQVRCPLQAISYITPQLPQPGTLPRTGHTQLPHNYPNQVRCPVQAIHNYPTTTPTRYAAPYRPYHTLAHNYPNQPLTVEVHYYYLLELSFCLSLLTHTHTHIRSKDFLLTLTHHFLSVSLIVFSYVSNMVRAGTLVMCVHDSAEVLLEAAKMAKYARFKRFCNLLFLIFTLIFITSRLALYPAWVLKTTVFESWSLLGLFPSWWLLNGMLLLLLGLHCLWAYLILRVLSTGPQRRKLNPLCVSLDSHNDVDFSSDEEDMPPHPPHPKKPPPHTHTSHRSQRTANGTSGAHRTNGYL